MNLEQMQRTMKPSRSRLKEAAENVCLQIDAGREIELHDIDTLLSSVLGVSQSGRKFSKINICKKLAKENGVFPIIVRKHKIIATNNIVIVSFGLGETAMKSGLHTPDLRPAAAGYIGMKGGINDRFLRQSKTGFITRFLDKKRSGIKADFKCFCVCDETPKNLAKYESSDGEYAFIDKRYHDIFSPHFDLKRVSMVRESADVMLLIAENNSPKEKLILVTCDIVDSDCQDVEEQR